MRRIHPLVKRLYEILEEAGYKPVIIGTYALVLQDWLPPDYLWETKDMDLYIASTEVFVDFDPGGGLYWRLVEEGFLVSFSEAGGILVTHSELERPVEILYPIGDVFVPDALLGETVTVEGVMVLEAHAVIVAKTLGDEHSLLRLADALRAGGVRIDEGRLRRLMDRVARELSEAGEPWRARVARRRLESFLARYRRYGSLRGVMA